MSNPAENNTIILMIFVHSLLGYWTSSFLFAIFLSEYNYLLTGHEFLPFVIFGTIINVSIYVFYLYCKQLLSK